MIDMSQTLWCPRMECILSIYNAVISTLVKP
uniref:Uncharacterized protein n=1 Tax=Anguilla anguilla TaxID=7936 RepID=A0A0E9RBT9_ANGAN